jgi:membrane-bound lytic murein transglycosylase D
MLMVPAAALNPAVCYSSPITPTPGRFMWIPSLHDTTKAVSPDSIASKSVTTKITLNKHVIGFVKSYLEKEEEFLQKMKGKSGHYFQTIEKVFDQYEIPIQLKYLAIVESELLSNARSRVGARGLWQLMPVTAKELGLRVSGKTDDRIHTYRSTVAAAKYLRNLYAQFGDWLLVLAAYNGGPGTIYKAIKKAGSKNFWALQRFLPAESRGHVKRFIGVHYFFEGEGSITTQTKAEAIAWQEKLCAEQVALSTVKPD